MILNIEIWIILAIVFFIIEMITPNFFIVWFGIGSIIASVMSYLGFDDNIQFITFVIVSLILFAGSKRFAKSVTKDNAKKAASDRLIGEEGVVVNDITKYSFGIVKIKGEEWLSESDENLFKEDKVKVIRISGVKLFVKKL